MMRALIILVIWSRLLYGEGNTFDGNWTWLHRKIFSVQNSTKEKDKKLLFFTQDCVSPFTQLIFSWNAFRPEKDHFSFHVQVRDATTKKWGAWHHMADWGKNIQKSYVSKSDGFSSHVYVRHEIDDKKIADGFRIKIEAQNAQSLSLMHSVFVSISNFNDFKVESDKFMNGTLPSVCLPNVPAIAQFSIVHEDKGRICSPVSCSMVVHYLTGVCQNPCEFASGVFDSGLGIYGSWIFNVVYAFECVGGKYNFFVKRMNSFSEVHQQLMKGMPVIVSVRGILPGAFKPFPHGHLMIVVGWDSNKREVLCNDPACDKKEMVFKRYPIHDFLRAWECSHRLVYVAEPVMR